MDVTHSTVWPLPHLLSYICKAHQIGICLVSNAYYSTILWYYQVSNIVTVPYKLRKYIFWLICRLQNTFSSVIKMCHDGGRQMAVKG